ncbi:MAG: HD domain-containing protein [Sphaerochaetaceae bacterium]|nr:HD domain-containing protein [Sphaerochaetaceae bacterium]
MKRFPISRKISRFVKPFFENGYSLYVVGGAVRDWAISRNVTDYDFATDATPQQVMSLFSHVIPTGIDHGTVTVMFAGDSYEVTTFRIDDEYLDSRHPKNVSFIANIEEDLKRRDFTINALAVDVSTNELIDLHEGIADLKKRIVRAIGDPEKRFTEDALRMLRAIRFSCSLEFTIEEKTKEAIKKLHPLLKHVSGERIHIELFKILESRKPSIAFSLMHETKILELLFPEISMGENITQKGMHRYSVMEHGFYSCDAAPRNKPLVRLAALLHDIGKSVVRKVDENGEVTFHRHEAESVKMAKDIMLRLKCSRQQMQKVLHLIEHHMFHYTSDWTDAAVRRFICKVSIDQIDDLFALRTADQIGTDGMAKPANLIEFSKRIQREIELKNVFTVKDLAVNGNDLAMAGIPKNKTMGLVLNELLETVLNDPSMNTREHLLEIALNFYNERIKLV